MMQNTIYCRIKNRDEEAIKDAVAKMVEKIQTYVPGYTLKVPPIFDDDRVTVIAQVIGAGDFLPVYAGNLDIINCAAVGAADIVAERILKGVR